MRVPVVIKNDITRVILKKVALYLFLGVFFALMVYKVVMPFTPFWVDIAVIILGLGCLVFVGLMRLTRSKELQTPPNDKPQ